MFSGGRERIDSMKLPYARYKVKLHHNIHHSLIIIAGKNKIKQNHSRTISAS